MDVKAGKIEQKSEPETQNQRPISDAQYRRKADKLARKFLMRKYL